MFKLSFLHPFFMAILVSLVFGQEGKAMSVVKKLVSLGCNINNGDSEWKTPLILSASAGSVGRL